MNNVSEFNATQDQQVLQARGRQFSRKDIALIQHIVKMRYSEGRWRISLAVCEGLNWFQENGWPKDRACRDVLNRFNNAGIITLPPPRGKVSLTDEKDLVDKYYNSATRFIQPDLVKGQLRAVLAKSDANEKIWNDLIRLHHYLGHTIQVGRTLKFLIYRDSDIIGAFALSEAAYNIAPRDKILKSLGAARSDVINNSRFLLIPSKAKKNDASRTLSLLTRCALTVWPAYYGRNVRLIETFVDTERFVGTSYRAANWILIGRTRGYRKSGSSFSNGQSSKMIFVYPLTPDERNLIVKGINNEQRR